MTTPQVYHKTLNATFSGIQREVDSAKVNQFLGIKYGSIPARFERALPVDDFGGHAVDATKFGYVWYTILHISF